MADAVKHGSNGWWWWGGQERMADVVAQGDGGCELFELSRHDFHDIVRRCALLVK